MITIAIEEIDGYTQVDIQSSLGVIELGKLNDTEKTEVARTLTEAASILLRDLSVNESIQLSDIADEL